MDGIDFLNSLTKWDNKSNFGLESLQKVLLRLNSPQDIPRSIHVGGTNGKGTTSVAIASILGAAGYTVGLNTSPHLIRLNERFIINGNEASDLEISSAALQVKESIIAEGVTLSFHEAITATAFVLFQKLDWIVIEVGLGGRLDASNVLNKPEISIITSISFDHEHILGNTLSKIAFEKAGIIKQNQILLTGDLPEEAIKVVKDVVNEKNSSHFEFGNDFNYRLVVDGLEFFSADNRLKITAYKFQNHIKTVNDCLAIRATSKIGISPKAIEQGIQNYYWPGRYEIISFLGKEFIIDAAHNPASIDALVDYLELNYSGKKDFSIIFAALQTKDWHYFVQKLKDYIVNWHIVLADSSVGVPTKEIQSYLSCLGINSCYEYQKYSDAISAVCQSKQERTIVAGSMYMIGGIKILLGDLQKPYWDHVTY